MRFLLLLLLLLPVSALACDFDCTVEKHLDAIQAQDFDSFAETMPEEGPVSLILPDGRYFDDTQVFLNLMRGWFDQGGWTFNYEVIRKVVGSDLGLVLLLVSYDEADRDGKPYHIDHYLNLVFRKEGDRWLLAHDQNTGITSKEEE